MFTKKIKEWLLANDIKSTYVFIDRNKPVPGGSITSHTIPIWVVHNSALLHSGITSVWDDFELFTNDYNPSVDTMDEIDVWIPKHFDGLLINFYITHFQPEYLMGWNLRKGGVVPTGKELNPLTLEDLLRMKVPAKDKDQNDIQMSPDFRVAVQRENDQGVHFIIHPIDHNGETIDFVVKGNHLQYLVTESTKGG